ncbi:PaaI family thioesterase [Bordetella sp. N]|uniref:PaaI family thioesterase n=1 Tax=Bordetella sp. N TaxID=1746199 RepID=UPI00070CFCAA|nr:PaaI family thioesterase [Bordetella sp. N]ALM82228.1 hypothetical protein ASB57_03975 [Bordetella sp. N]
MTVTLNTGAPASDALDALRRELAHPPFHAVLAPEAISADADRGEVRIRLPYQATFRRAAGSDAIHGGVIAALADLAAHAAVAVQIGRMAPTIDLRIDYLRPAPGQDLYAKASTLRVGRAVARVDVVISGADTPPYAVARGSFSTLAPEPVRSPS